MKHKIQIPKTMTLMLVFFTFVVMFITMSFMGLMMFLYLSFKYQTFIEIPDFTRPIPMLVIVSTIVGVALTAFLSRIPLKPIRQLISAMDQLANGDFSVRIHLDHTDELEQLSRSFNRMAEELGNTELLRSDFINNFSHEFKTPIVSLRGFAKILKNNTLTDEERHEYLDIIISESNRLAQLSANVLNLSKVENLSIVTENEAFDLAEQIRRTILLLEPKWSRKNLDLIIDLDDITFYGNSSLLDQVWINLIDNAVKFSLDHSKIKIQLKQEEGFIVFRAIDNGYGMNADTREHIFDRFYQGDPSHAMEGNGIGLTVVQKIVALCKGTITVESEIGVGSIFTVRLPSKGGNCTG